ncbi:hypothetical protein FKW77_001215 [Venturia effusa]|uniref:Endonuclease/exonuclease/phosphatase domain-containing protein n=1 Tax=Venturia effusa TaxID=50376 RepID=A0A517LPH5_9PEZI|nr:hypothetical protein FKW77_001215 [Venturia effusa]
MKKFLRIVQKNVRGSNELHRELADDAVYADIWLIQDVGSSYRLIDVADYEVVVWPGPSRIRVYVRIGLNLGIRNLIQHDEYFPTLEFDSIDLGLVHLHNAYSSSIGKIDLEDVFAKVSKVDAEHLLMGNFNLRHPDWGGEDVIINHFAAERSTTLAAHSSLELLTLRGAKTWEKELGSRT